MYVVCKSCHKKVRAVYLRTLSRFTRKEFRPAEDGDSPNEIVVDHYQNIRTTVNLYKVAKHKKGIIFRKQCPKSGFTFKKTRQSDIGRPYTIHKVRR